jgi:zinc/manganese transport system permease protein
MMDEFVDLLLYPAAAAVVFVGMHTWLGLQVLRRDVIFADLALAQLSALGATVAVAIGHAPASTAAFSYALMFAMLGALLLTGLRRFSRQVSQEAVIGIAYVVTTALTILVIDRSPQGAEHVKKMLVGSILAIGPDEVAQLVVVYGAIGLVHFVFRRQLLKSASSGLDGPNMIVWDLLFYGSFGVVVTSSVSLAGVLLVFSFLIIPAVIGNIFSSRISVALWIGWAAGIAASFAGFSASLVFDAPTGALLVAFFAQTLAVAVIVRLLVFRPPGRRRVAGRTAAMVAGTAVCIGVFAQGLWSLAAPAADQPLVALLEAANIVNPGQFLTATERRQLSEAEANEVRYRIQVEQLLDMEREARWKGSGLSEDEVQTLSAFQRSFNEMGQGERFVQDHLRKTARARGRWYIGIPAVVLSLLGFIVIGAIYLRGRSHTRSLSLS